MKLEKNYDLEHTYTKEQEKINLVPVLEQAS